MKAKIFLMENVHSNNDYDGWTSHVLRESLTDGWEDISAEDLDLLKKHLRKIKYTNYNFEPVLVVLDDTPLFERISSIKKLIEESQREREIERAKREVARAARLAKKIAKEEEREKLLYEALSKKFKKEK